jgi:hypothetical protein
MNLSLLSYVGFLAVEINIFDSDLSRLLENFSDNIIDFFSTLFPYLLSISIAILNISFICGGINYLLDYNEENGKLIIIRSFILLLLIFFIFNPSSSESTIFTDSLEGFRELISFITSYLLFIFAALSLIMFIINLGLLFTIYDYKRVKKIKKCVLCLLCTLLPLGFQFPSMPSWVM